MKLQDISSIQDFDLLDTEGEPECSLLKVYSPNEALSPKETLKRASELDATISSSLTTILPDLQTNASKIITHITLWLHLKNKGLPHLQKALECLSEYFKETSLERDQETGVFTYEFLFGLLYNIPLLVKKEDVLLLTELSEFLETYENNLRIFTNKVFESEVIIQPNAPFWLLKPLLGFYCSKKAAAFNNLNFKELINLLLDKYISIKDIHWAKNILDDFESCFSYEERIVMKTKVAKLYCNVGIALSGLKAISFLKIAANMFQQIEDYGSMDSALSAVKQKESTIDWKISELTLPLELQDKFEQEIAGRISTLKELRLLTRQANRAEIVYNIGWKNEMHASSAEMHSRTFAIKQCV